MIKIHKQPLDIPFNLYVEIHLPKGANIIEVNTQHGTPTIWYEFEYKSGKDVPYEVREFVIRPTGRGFERSKEVGEEKHLGTCLSNKGRLVYHIYEVL